MRDRPFGSRKSLLPWIALICLSASVAGAQSWLTQRVGPYDEIDWRARVAHSLGQSKSGGQEGLIEAEEGAIASMVDILSRVRIDAGTTVANRVEERPELSALLSTRIRDVASRRRSTRADGGLIVRLELDFLTALSPLVAPPIGGGKPLVPLVCPTCGQRWPEARPFPVGVDQGGAEGPAITGIVLQTGSLRYEPALFPRLVDLEGHEVYGPAFAHDAVVHVDGLVAYLSPGDPLLGHRVGANPLVLAPLGVRAGCDFVLGDDEVRRMHGSARSLKMLQECRVVVMSGEARVEVSNAQRGGTR